MRTNVLTFPDECVGELVDERFRALPKIADARGRVTIFGRPKLVLRLTETVTEHLSFLKSLRQDALYGIHFGFARILDSDLANLSSLTRLRLVDISSTGIGDDGFLLMLRTLPHLRSIGFGGTRVTDFALRDMPPSPRMKVFESSGRRVKIGDKGAHSIGDKFPNLLNLCLSRTDITDEGVRGINHLTLRTLNIGMTRVTDIGVAHLQGMNSLRRLSLHDIVISDSALYFLQRLDKLEFLDLSGTAIGAEGLERLSDLPRLRVLLASGVKLSSRTAAVLARMTGLRTLSLGLQTDAALLVRLREKLSSCKVLAQVRA